MNSNGQEYIDYMEGPRCPADGTKLITEKEWIAEHQYQYVDTCPACGYQEIGYN